MKPITEAQYRDMASSMQSKALAEGFYYIPLSQYRDEYGVLPPWYKPPLERDTLEEVDDDEADDDGAGDDDSLA